MDNRLVGMSTTDKVLPHGLVYSRAWLRTLSTVNSSRSDGESYGDY